MPQNSYLKTITARIIAVLFVLSSAASVIAAEENPVEASAIDYPQHYIMGPGDVLNISVWKNEDLTRIVPVLPDGKISFPLVGEFVAGGKRVDDLRAEIVQKLGSYVKDPVLTVMVQQINSLNIYVIGKVNNPGRFALNTTVNALQALAMAGGLNPFAKKEQILIFREEKGQTKIFPFNYEEVAKGAGLAQNISLKRGDVIVVP